MEVYSRFIPSFIAEASCSDFHSLNFAVDTFSHYIVRVENDGIADVPEMSRKSLRCPFIGLSWLSIACAHQRSHAFFAQTREL